MLRKKKRTASEVARLVGRTPRTVRRYASWGREEYEQNAQARRDRARELRAKGLKWREVGEEMGISAEAARSLGKQAKQKRSSRTYHVR